MPNFTFIHFYYEFNPNKIIKQRFGRIIQIYLNNKKMKTKKRSMRSNILWANSFDSNRQCLKMKIRFLRNRHCRIVSFSKWNIISFEENWFFFFGFPIDTNHTLNLVNMLYTCVSEFDINSRFAMLHIHLCRQPGWGKSFLTLSPLDNAIHIVDMAVLYISFKNIENLYDSEHSPTIFTERMNEWEIMAVLLIPEICNFVMKSNRLEPKAEMNHNKYGRCYPSILWWIVDFAWGEHRKYTLNVAAN